MAPRPETQFLLRRLHSLSGVIPIGVFLAEHMFTNSFSHQPETYNFIVQKMILGMPMPVFRSMEIGILAIPILFHVALGIHFTRTSSVNQHQYSYPKNWAYLLQRITGIITVFFLLYHVIALRIMQPDAVHADPFLATKNHLLANAELNAVIYTVGIAAASFHFGNGLWTFLVTWGIIVGRQTQKMAHVACLGVWLGVMSLGFYGLFGFYVTQPPAVQASDAHVTDGATNKDSTPPGDH